MSDKVSCKFCGSLNTGEVLPGEGGNFALMVVNAKTDPITPVNYHPIRLYGCTDCGIILLHQSEMEIVE